MKNKSLTFKFTLMFAGFTLITLAVTSLLSYFNQMQIYKNQREESILYVADYLEKVVVSDADNFLDMQNYFLAHSKEFKIPVNFGEDEIKESRVRYETLRQNQYPGLVIGKDILFEELSDEVKAAHAIYNYEYYRYMFEEAAKILRYHLCLLSRSDWRVWSCLLVLGRNPRA